MAKASKKDDHAEMDAVLKVMLEMPPKPHEPLKGREPKPAPKKKKPAR
jgi:hypothetical protein